MTLSGPRCGVYAGSCELGWRQAAIHDSYHTNAAGEQGGSARALWVGSRGPGAHRGIRARRAGRARRVRLRREGGIEDGMCCERVQSRHILRRLYGGSATRRREDGPLWEPGRDPQGDADGRDGRLGREDRAHRAGVACAGSPGVSGALWGRSHERIGRGAPVLHSGGGSSGESDVAAGAPLRRTGQIRGVGERVHQLHRRSRNGHGQGAHQIAAPGCAAVRRASVRASRDTWVCSRRRSGPSPAAARWAAR